MTGKNIKSNYNAYDGDLSVKDGVSPAFLKTFGTNHIQKKKIMLYDKLHDKYKVGKHKLIEGGGVGGGNANLSVNTNKDDVIDVARAYYTQRTNT